MDNREFLDGIDEDFQRLASKQPNGKTNGFEFPQQAAQPMQESATSRILAQLPQLTHAQREAILVFIESLRRKGSE